MSAEQKEKIVPKFNARENLQRPNETTEFSMEELMVFKENPDLESAPKRRALMEEALRYLDFRGMGEPDQYRAVIAFADIHGRTSFVRVESDPRKGDLFRKGS